MSARVRREVRVGMSPDLQAVRTRCLRSAGSSGLGGVVSGASCVVLTSVSMDGSGREVIVTTVLSLTSTGKSWVEGISEMSVVILIGSLRAGLC